MDSNPKSWLDHLLGIAVTACFIAVLLVVGVHLIQSIFPELLLGLVAGGAVAVIVLVIRRHHRNRYW